MEGVQGFKDLPLVVSLSSGDPGILAWVQIANARHHIKVAGGSTAVQAPQFYPYLQSRQLCGFLGGLRGAAEYETLVQEKGMASKGMDSQSFGHLLILLLILLANGLILMEKFVQAR
jgi:hypothetical protein